METLNLNLQVLNLVISGSVCAILLGLLVLQRVRKGEYWLLNANEYPNTTWALGLWCAWWLTLFLIYLELNNLPYKVILMFSDFGNLCALGAAIAYCKGKDFKLAVISPLLGVFVIVFLWDLAMTSSPSVSKYYQGRIVTIAPSLLISGISSLALGWAVVVRCGWTAWPFLLCAASYSVAQLPAYFHVFVLHGEKVAMGGQSLNKLVWSLLFLALGKIIYAWIFLGYFFSPQHERKDLEAREYWPNEKRKVRMHPTYAKGLRWAIGIMLASFLAAFAAAWVPNFIEKIKGAFSA